uniref:Uncharacterized protein n=1 Tax=Arundo donax TaxID=35708 RepID=A0A0A9B1P9_ARUDO
MPTQIQSSATSYLFGATSQEAFA